MKQKILTTCFALACSAALLWAQSPQSNAGSSSQSDRSSSTTHTSRSSKADRSSSKGSITLTGCLQAGTEPNTFMLNNVSETGSQASSNASNTGSAPSEMARAESSYILVPNSKKVDLSKHIGQRVEVMGTLMPANSNMHSGMGSGSQGSTGSSSSSSTSSSSGTSSASMGQSGSMSSDMSEHQIKVRSIRQIASTCP